MNVLLQHNPYHITTLLQCSEIFHHQRDFTVAGDLLERALFSLGRSLHSSFQQKLAEGSARLSFRRPENRELFLCVWRYITNLSQRGTWRTAEEFARLLLAMDPEGDPYEMCLIIDFLALKARQPERFLALTEHPTLRRKYADLPNIAFSSALAQLQLGDESLATEYLSKAITRFPWIPTMLYQELGVSTQLPPALWGVPPPDDNPRQQILASLYIERTKDLWKQPAFTTFLVNTCSTIYNLPKTRLLGSSSPSVSMSLARHVMLTAMPSLITLLPREITSRDTSSFDPLPPDDDLLSYEAEPPNLAPMIRETAGGGNAFSAFVMSIIPWFRVGEDGEIDGRQMNETERAQYRDIRQQLEQAGYPDDALRRMGDEAYEVQRIMREQQEDGQAEGRGQVEGAGRAEEEET